MKKDYAPESILCNRRNKTARGMTNTAYRSGHSRRFSNDMITLSVRGTLDRLGRLYLLVARAPCECCGSKTNGKLRLNDHGRLRLWATRRKAGKNGD